MKRLSFVGLLCLLVIITGCSKTDISGIWKGKLIPASGKELGVETLFKQNNKDISGTLTMRDIGGQLKLTGSVEGDKLSFNTEMHSGLYISFVGNIEKTMIKGKADVTMEGPNVPGGIQTETMTLELTKK
jgi:hypothetical protein